MFVVEWDDHEGNRREMAFDSLEDAELEAAKLKECFDFVAVVEKTEA